MTARAELRARYEAEGYLCPLEGLSQEEAVAACERLQALLGGRAILPPAQRFNPHLLLGWVAEIATDARILDRVEDVLGTDILVWRTSFFLKSAGSPSFVAWHQDSAYWGLDGRNVATAWVALSDSLEANGCVRVLPGSHREPELPHVLDTSESNLLVRGQRIAVVVPDERTRPLELRAGQFSLHNVGLAHGSGPNRSASPRLGLAIRYLAPEVRPRYGRHGAALARGHDLFGHFLLEPFATGDAAASSRVHGASLRRYAGELVASAWRESKLDALSLLTRLALRPGTWRTLLLLAARPWGRAALRSRP